MTKICDELKVISQLSLIKQRGELYESEVTL